MRPALFITRLRELIAFYPSSERRQAAGYLNEEIEYRLDERHYIRAEATFRSRSDTSFRVRGQTPRPPIG